MEFQKEGIRHNYESDEGNVAAHRQRAIGYLDGF